MAAPGPLAFLDTETDGLDPDRRIWDIAIIRRDPDGTETEWQAYLDIDLSTANLHALRIGRFYDRHPLGQHLSGKRSVQPSAYRTGDDQLLPPEDAVLDIARLTHGATIVGAVPNFDTEAIEKLLRTNRIVPAWHHRLRCVETLTAGHLRRELGGLHACAEALDIPAWDEHTALGDTRAARDIYDAIMTRKALAA